MVSVLAQVRGQHQKDRSTVEKQAPSQSMVTFATRADFQESGSQALSGADAETRVFWVLLLAGQDGARWREAVRWDSFYLHIFLEIHVDGPVEDNQNQFIQHIFKAACVVRHLLRSTQAKNVFSHTFLMPSATKTVSGVTRLMVFISGPISTLNYSRERMCVLFSE